MKSLFGICSELSTISFRHRLIHLHLFLRNCPAHFHLDTEVIGSYFSPSETPFTCHQAENPVFKTNSTPEPCSATRWWLRILLGIILLAETGLSWAAEPDSTLGAASPAPWQRFISAGGKVGWAAVQSVATANYRAYDLEDLVPLEQVYLPKIALPQEEHPSLLFCEDEKDLIRQRTLREPYSGWWGIVLQRAETGLATDLSNPQLEESRRAYAAKSCAFAYVVTGELPFLEKAREGLLHISPPPAVTTPEGGRTGQGWGDWVRASALMLDYCVAYDLVAQDLSPENRHLVTEKIAAETEQLYRGLIFAPPNNHKTLMAVAVGTAALTIPSYGWKETQTWLDAAIINLRSGLAQIDGDGSYREGVFYAGYIARLLFPFALYLRRTTGEDLFRHRRIEDLVQWVLRIGKPDGSIPLFDDAWQKTRTYLPILVGQSRLGGVARWIYESEPREASDQVNEVEFICAFDDRVAPEHPPWERTAFFPDGGMAVFGDDWSSKGIYLLLLGEEKRTLASSHEHIDPGNFVLHANGQDLIIDSGYGPRGRISTSRPWHLSAEGHNMLLVDGRGPNANLFSQDQLGGHLVHCFRSTPVSGAAVKARYGGTDIQRTVYFLGQRYFIVFDWLASPEPHDYELVLHGMGRAQREEPERVTWASGTGKLLVEFLSPAQPPPEVSLRTGQHTPYYGGWETHTYIRARKPRMREAHFTTLLLPQRVGSWGLKSVDLPVLSAGLAQAREISGERLNGCRHQVITTDGQQASAGGVTTDGLVCVTGFGADGEREFFVNAQGTFYTQLGDTCYFSDRPVTITMLTGRDRWAGYVDAGSEEVVIQMETDFDPGHVRFGEFPIDYEYREGRVWLRLKGSGPLELGAGPPMMFTPQGSRERFPFLERLAGQREPMARWEELSPEQRFLVENQALALTRKGLNEPIEELSTKVGLGPKGFERALGLVTGLADQAYDPQNWARLNLPQHLEGQRALAGATLTYAQEGHLTEGGWRVERLEGQLSEGSWGSVKVGHYSPFPEAMLRTLRLDTRKFSLVTGLEKMKEKQRHQFSTSYLWGSATWGLDVYTQDGDDDYGLNLFWRGRSVTAEASQYRGPGITPGRRLFLSHRGRAFSPQAELWDPGASGEMELRMSWASAPFRGITWEFSSLLDQLPRHPLIREVGNTVSCRGGAGNGQLYIFYQEGRGSHGWVTFTQEWSTSRWNVGANFLQWGRPFVSEEKFSLLWNWNGWASLSTALSHRHHSPLGDDALSLELSGHLRPEKATRIQLRMEGSSPQSRPTAWGLGIDRWGQLSWGGGWTRLRPRGRESGSQLSIHGGWTGDGRTGLRGRAELELSSENRIEAYQIEFSQEGSTCSPGLLLSKDPMTGVRNDGFLRFRF
jgi:hypothetical protein